MTSRVLALIRAPGQTRARGIRVALILGMLIAAVVAPPYLPPFLLTVVMLSLVYAILAMSLDILMGYTGMESLGQAAFFGIGAYTVGIVMTRHGAASWPWAVLLALGLGALSAAVAGLAGGIGAPFLGAYQGAQFDILLLALIVVVVGGLGSIAGAFVASMVVGILDSVGKSLFPSLAYFTLFAPMIIILVLRPTGLRGRA